MKFSETLTQNKNQNISWINNLRLIAMLAVVVLHTASPALSAYNSTPTPQWLAADAYNALVRFAVPVFVMITGALLLPREYNLNSFLKKRIGRLIVPFLFWSLVYVAYQWYIEIIPFTGNWWGDTKLVLHQLKTGSSYHLWYVYLLFGLYLIIPVIGKFVRNATEKELLYFLTIWFITVLLGKPYLTRFDTAVDLRYFSGYIGYLVLGYYLANKRFYIPAMGFLAFVVFAASVALITSGTYYLQVSQHELSTFFYEPVGPFIVILASAAFLMAKNMTVSMSPAITKITDNAGKYTLGIYLSHALVLSILELNDINYAIFNTMLSIPIIAISSFLLSWLLIYVLSKIPLLKYVAG